MSRGLRVRRVPWNDDRGFALIGVILFAFIVFLLATSFFAMASYESRAAVYRQHSSESFSLADGAIERARGEFMQSISWRGPLAGEAAGSGTYDLTVTDTTWTDGRDAVLLQARGHVGGAHRGVDVWAELKNPIQIGIMIVNRNMDAEGNFCLNGHIHVNEDLDIVNPRCDYEFTNFCCVEPFKMYTEPERFPGATYYYVVGQNVGNAFFPILAGDSTVVINFGTSPFDAISDVQLKMRPFDPPIEATIINSRFIGASEEQRTDWRFWTGGQTSLQTRAQIAPKNGIGLITHTLDQSQALVSVGTPEDPGLLYVTMDVDDVQGQFAVYGAVVVLRDWVSQGGPDITFDPEFIARLPQSFKDSIQLDPDQTGIMAVLEWREVATGP